MKYMGTTMLYLIVILSKVIKLISRFFRLGSGGTWPGHVALKIYPGILRTTKLAPGKGVVLVSGTNGKTTVTKMVVHVLRKKGLEVTTNASGANLLNGVVTAVLSGAGLFHEKKVDYFILEVDEFALPSVLNELKPKVVSLLNLSRDQLDRYGETDVILEKWEDALKKTAVPCVVLDRSLEYFRRMHFPSETLIVDFSRVPKDNFPEELAGLFYVQNVQSALSTLSFLGIHETESLSLLSDFQAAYGRGEAVVHGGKMFHLFLAKNPASLSNNLRFFEIKKDLFNAVLFVLNDNIPDGRDVSWIYDVSPNLILSSCGEEKVFVSGGRCYDMAVRLQYAGLSLQEDNISPDLSIIKERILKDSTVSNVAVFPNYSAMLEFRKLLIGRKIL